MVKRLLIIIFAVALFGGVPSSVMAETSAEMIDNEPQDISFSVSGNILHVAGAAGEMLYVYNIAGVRVMSIKIEGADKRYDLNLPKGCYILKVGKVVRKISIK